MSVKLKAKILLGIMMLTPIFGFTNAVPEVSAVRPSMEQRQFNNAVSSGNVEAVRALLDEGFDVNMYLGLGSEKTALYIAVEKGNLEMVKCLLEHNANPNMVVYDSRTSKTAALHIAVEKGNLEMVKLLLEHNAKPNMVVYDSRTSKTALHIAVEKGNPEMVKCLLEHHANPNMVVLDGKTNKTALHIAVEKGNLEMVKCLLDSGANVNAINIDGNIALEIAVEKGNIGMVELLLKYEAAPGTIAPVDTALDTAVEQGYVEIVRLLLDHSSGRFVLSNNALHIAVIKNNKEMVQLLLDKGADVNIIREYGDTALHVAARNSDEEMVKCLLDGGVKVNATNIDGQTALHIAFSRSNLKMVKLLLENGADPKTVAHVGTALYTAVEQGNVEIFNLLLENGADPNAVRGDGRTALHIAIKKGNLEMVKCLLEHHANPNMVVLDGKTNKTALHIAVEKGNPEMVKLLLDKGADVNIISKYGETALHIAVEKGNPEMVKLLLDKGADVNITSEYGDTALYIAVEKGNAEISELLLESHANPDITVRGKTALHLAIEKNNSYICKKLIEHVQNPRAEYGALYCAIELGKTDIASALLEKFSASEVEKLMGEKIIYWLYDAVHRCGSEVIKKLLKLGLKPDCELVDEAIKSGKSDSALALLDKLPASEVEKLKKNSHDLLEHAVRACDHNVMKKLLDLGANPMAKDYCFETTALDDAIGFGKSDIALELLKKLSASEVEKLKKNSNGLLICAVRECDHEVVEKLLELGLQPDCKLVEKAIQLGKSDSALALLGKLSAKEIDILRKNSGLLYCAAHNCDENVVNQLVEFGMGNQYDLLSVAIARNQQEVAFRILDDHFNEIKEKSSCLLCIAARENRLWAVNELLSRGADPMVKDRTDLTALDYAIKYDRVGDHQEVVEAMLRKVPAEVEDPKWLFLAAQGGNYWAVDKLLKRGVSLSAVEKDEYGNNCSALRIALNNGYIGIAKKILQKLFPKDIENLKKKDPLLFSTHWFYLPRDLREKFLPANKS